MSAPSQSIDTLPGVPYNVACAMHLLRLMHWRTLPIVAVAGDNIDAVKVDELSQPEECARGAAADLLEAYFAGKLDENGRRAGQPTKSSPTPPVPPTPPQPMPARPFQFLEIQCHLCKGAKGNLQCNVCGGDGTFACVPSSLVRIPQ